jgi:hypothetical protein
MPSGGPHRYPDSHFAETVNLHKPYHVFVQTYGNATVYMSQRTPSIFEVSRRGSRKRMYHNAYTRKAVLIHSRCESLP